MDYFATDAPPAENAAPASGTAAPQATGGDLAMNDEIS